MSAAARPAGNVVVISPDDGHQPGAVAPTGPESRLFCDRTAIIIQHRHGHANDPRTARLPPVHCAGQSASGRSSLGSAHHWIASGSNYRKDSIGGGCRTSKVGLTRSSAPPAARSGNRRCWPAPRTAASCSNSTSMPSRIFAECQYVVGRRTAAPVACDRSGRRAARWMNMVDRRRRVGRSGMRFAARRRRNGAHRSHAGWEPGWSCRHHAMMRVLLAERVALLPRALRLIRDARGKPRFADTDESHFNLGHSAS